MPVEVIPSVPARGTEPPEVAGRPDADPVAADAAHDYQNVQCHHPPFELTNGASSGRAGVPELRKRIREHQPGDVIGAARRAAPPCGDLRPPLPKHTHAIRSTHWARHAGGSNGSAKYCVSRATLPAWSSMMLTVLTRRPS